MLVNIFCNKWLIPIVWSTIERWLQRLSCRNVTCESQISARESLRPARYDPHFSFFFNNFLARFRSLTNEKSHEFELEYANKIRLK